MRLGYIEDGQPVEITGKWYVNDEGTQYPIRKMTSEEQLAIGVYPIVRITPTVPDGQIVDGWSMALVGQEIQETAILRPMTQEELDQADANRKDATWAEYRRRVYSAMPTEAEAHFGLRLGMFAALRTNGSTVQEAMAASLLTQEDYQALQDLIVWQEDMRLAGKNIFQNDLGIYDDANWLSVPQSVIDMMARAGFEE